ncbi:crotonase/enoyl-CoA hydratase family protein [Paracoccus gahaiensis]|uniref:Crotonase/enoyl-CoA hydratase family protein n=1 Tax=Paracoccus gahaiensis TaxID=1706839 RepID=A0A4U0R927_9RHOB|nr:crotonase/enoyl-CoA hydratase family protein [Paracoccus gahaiensis]TJZ90940.1 crotonase/enoyl-CoA hydratase family protein [Paracoccus gahaiensis]
MTEELVSYECRDQVAVLGLARPGKRNAISDRVVEALALAIERARTEAKAAVLHGHGAHFCAGLDLAEHVARTPFEGVLNSRRWHEVFARIELGPIPWFAAIHGAAVGGGLELAAAAQVRVCDETAFFALPEGTRGIFVGGGGSVRAARLLGISRMTDMMLTGRSIDADTAERWGLVHYVTPPRQALDRAIALAQKAAGNAHLSNYAIINALPRIAEMSRDDGLFMESFIASFTATDPEAEARLRDFLDRKTGRVAPPAAR